MESKVVPGKVKGVTSNGRLWKLFKTSCTYGSCLGNEHTRKRSFSVVRMKTPRGDRAVFRNYFWIANERCSRSRRASKATRIDNLRYNRLNGKFARKRDSEFRNFISKDFRRRRSLSLNRLREFVSSWLQEQSDVFCDSTTERLTLKSNHSYRRISLNNDAAIELFLTRERATTKLCNPECLRCTKPVKTIVG